MEENAMKGRALWNVKGGKTVQERKPAGRGQAVQRALMTAGAIVGAVLLIGTMVAPLCAQSYPNRSIRLVIPFTPGGTADILGRIVAQRLTEQLGQSVVPENRGGAGGDIGASIVAKSKPDGYTLLLPSSSLAISPSLNKDLNYDAVKDLAPITPAGQIPLVVIVRASLPVKNIKEFLEYARANPGKLNYASSGVGTAAQLATELFKRRAKLTIQHVPYKSAGDVLNSLLSNETDLGLVGPPTALAQVKAGKVRAIVVLKEGKNRVPTMPNVPTTTEAGIDDCESGVWFGLFAPAGTPNDIINRVNAEWVKIAAMPDTIELMKKADLEPMSSTPEQFSKFFKAEMVRWSEVIREAKLSSK
jgi:tripartite-type tricarboxylate transporter receptor subunit TctC